MGYRNDCGATEQQPKRHAQKYAVNDDLEPASSAATTIDFAASAAATIKFSAVAATALATAPASAP